MFMLERTQPDSSRLYCETVIADDYSPRLLTYKVLGVYGYPIRLRESKDTDPWSPVGMGISRGDNQSAVQIGGTLVAEADSISTRDKARAIIGNLSYYGNYRVLEYVGSYTHPEILKLLLDGKTDEFHRHGGGWVETEANLPPSTLERCFVASYERTLNSRSLLAQAFEHIPEEIDYDTRGLYERLTQNEVRPIEVLEMSLIMSTLLDDIVSKHPELGPNSKYIEPLREDETLPYYRSDRRNHLMSLSRMSLPIRRMASRFISRFCAFIR